MILRRALYDLLILLQLVAIVSCTSEQNFSDVKDGSMIPICVETNNFVPTEKTETRITNSALTTSFTNGDKIGIYIVNGSTISYTNLLYTYNGTSWDNTNYGTNVPYVAGGKYFAYYPYNSAYNGTTTYVASSSTTASDFFGPLINSWTPAADQSSVDKLAAQDLMVAVGTVSSNKYTFQMVHQMGMLDINFAQIAYMYYCGNSYVTQLSYTFGKYTPYNVSAGKYRLLINPLKASEVYGDHLDEDGSSNGYWLVSKSNFPSTGQYKQYGTTASYTVQVVEPNIGDAYNSDGTYGEADYSIKTPIGIIVSTNQTYCEYSHGYGHGLVMAMKNASNSSIWCSSSAKGFTSDLSLTNITTGALWKGDASGLNNTYVIESLSDYSTSGYYPAFVAAKAYINSVPVPAGASCWFLPSSGQWLEALSNGQDLYGSGTIPYSTFGNSTTNNLGKIGAYASDCCEAMTNLFSNWTEYSNLEYTGFDYPSSAQHVYWTSSEVGSQWATYFAVNSGGDLYLYYSVKNPSWSVYVRPFLAF